MSSPNRSAGGREAAAEIPLRWLLIAAQAVTLWITWPLCQVRTQPPPLPLLPLPQFDMGVPLLASLAAIAFRPRPAPRSCVTIGTRLDSAVWPWNAAFACVAPMLLLTWRGPGLGDAWAQAAPWARAASAALMVMPAGYWLGVTDASLAHCLYAGNVPRAYICTPFSRVDINTRIARLNVFVTPAHWLFDPLFLGVGRAGQWREVDDPRWIAARCGWARRQVRWNDHAPAPVVAPPTRSPVADP